MLVRPASSGSVSGAVQSGESPGDRLGVRVGLASEGEKDTSANSGTAWAEGLAGDHGAASALSEPDGTRESSDVASGV